MRQRTRRAVALAGSGHGGAFLLGLAFGLIVIAVIVFAVVPAYPQDAHILTLQTDADTDKVQFRAMRLDSANTDSTHCWFQDTLKSDFPRICAQGKGPVTGEVR